MNREDVVVHGRGPLRHRLLFAVSGLRTCDECDADQFSCARKASNGGRACCERCSHVTTRQVQR